MSLWFYRRRILQAVAAELTATEEAALRGHLRTCLPCRGYYDQASRAAEGIGGTGVAARERARLVEGLRAATDAATTKPSVPVWRRRFALVFLAPAAAAALWLVHLRSERERSLPLAGGGAAEITWRGGGDEVASSFHLLVHARRKAEVAAAAGDRTQPPLRLVADLPGSGEGRVSLQDYVQFSYRGLEQPAYLILVGIGEGGRLRTYFPRADVPSGPLLPGAETKSLGPSFDLGQGHSAGPVRLRVLLSPRPLDGAEIEAVLRAESAAPVVQLAGTLIIDP